MSIFEFSPYLPAAYGIPVREVADVRALKPTAPNGPGFNHYHRRRVKQTQEWKEDTLEFDPPPPDDGFYLDTNLSIYAMNNGRAVGVLPARTTTYSMKFLRRGSGSGESWQIIDVVNGLDKIDANPLYQRCIDYTASGRIYIVWSNGNDLKLRLVYSDNEGDTWSAISESSPGFAGNIDGTMVVRGSKVIVFNRKAANASIQHYVWDNGWIGPIGTGISGTYSGGMRAARAYDYSAQSVIYIFDPFLSISGQELRYRSIINDDGEVGSFETITEFPEQLNTLNRIAHYYDDEERPVALWNATPTTGRKKIRTPSGWTSAEDFNLTDSTNVDALFLRLGIHQNNPDAYVVTLHRDPDSGASGGRKFR